LPSGKGRMSCPRGGVGFGEKTRSAFPGKKKRGSSEGFEKEGMMELEKRKS